MRDRQIWRVVPFGGGWTWTDGTFGIGHHRRAGNKTHIYVVKHLGAKELKRVMDPFARDPQTTLKLMNYAI